MKRKVLLIGFIVFMTIGLFGQNQKKTSKMSFYAAMDMGFASSVVSSDAISGYFGGLQIVPYFGISPFGQKLPLSFELAVQMDFIGRVDDNLQICFTTIAPQFLVAYKFNLGLLKPYLKAGIGVNINSGKSKINEGNFSVSNNIATSPSVSLVLNPGVEFNISKLISIVCYGRFNFNVVDLSVEGTKIANGAYLGTQTFGLGTKFNF